MNSRTIARNSFWYGVETFFSLFLTFFTSIIIARTVGPAKLGYFLYIWWIAGVASTVGSLGIPAATRKYMSEYFGRGQMGIVRSVFYKTLRLQILVSGAITLICLMCVWWFGDIEYRTISLLMLGSIFPSMVNSIAAGANTALEDMRANVPGSLVSTAIFVVAVFSSVALGWGLLGISIGLLTMRTVELLVRIVPLIRRLHAFEAEPVDLALGRRMFTFSGQSLILMVLGLIVWDRSELVVLKNFCPDIRQVAFYSVAFNITERLLVISQVFATATGATMMVQYGRDRNLVGGLVGTSARYLALISFPIHFGLAALAAPVLWIVYGAKYQEAVPALIIAACLGIPKAFIVPVQALLSSWEKQRLIIRWGLVCGAFNIILDFALIPRYGAIGAAVANGTTQMFSALALWIVALQLLNVKVPVWIIAKTALVAAVMALSVHLAATWLSALPAVVVGGLTGAFVYLALLRLAHVLQTSDRDRFSRLESHIPRQVRWILRVSLGWLIPGAPIAAEIL